MSRRILRSFGLTSAAVAMATVAMLAGTSPSLAQGNVPAIGEVDQCIPLSRIKRTKAVDNQTIVVEMRGQDGWRKMETASRCIGLKIEDSFSYSTSLTQLCKGDIIRVLGTGGARCGLSQITAISEEDAKALMKKK
ncbi:MAG: hypothetical protein HN793_07430 [Rhodospirillaceae bacterium]|jgi:hypothetical protein|nr:hypothetical protein [Rhodospirillaceae bacterium]MBT5564335.1 hypothetical protein [Rhodospirillaceae bacterium]MBT6090102.1 hypothetical protein [Rhodospirillaceae bacterium]MBT6960227.1 hypothetical protein [Rhodospirillaceae bacterium]MBT7450644.1 hypothetical protein [Rhodospirillaceae bacterium]